jgi:hypothetical protein
LAISRTVGLIDLLEVSVISWLNVTLTPGRGLEKNRQVEIEHRNDWQLTKHINIYIAMNSMYIVCIYIYVYIYIVCI